MRTIAITKGYVTQVDDEDYEMLMQKKWQAYVDTNTVYVKGAARKSDSERSRTMVFMHRVILKVSDPRIKIDHIDGNGLNNQKGNLRTATERENTRNRRKAVGKSSKYKGVTFNKATGKWRANMMIDAKHVYLGAFDEEVDAAYAYDAYAKIAFGDFSKLNFS